MSAVRDARKKVAKANRTVEGKRAIHFEVELEGKSILNSLFVYTDEQINYLMDYNLNNEVTEESSYTILMKTVMPQCLAFIDNKLEWDSLKMSKGEVQNDLITNLWSAVGSHILANEYRAVWATTNDNDMVYNLNITIDSDGEVEINGYNGLEGYQGVIMTKGINNFFNQVKNKINFPPKGMVVLTPKNS
jgi:hypothetical protein